ncbi:MAG: glutamate 5-kinase [Candidatus Glassbacteria bacterium]|nr:glutamate 5-kinase [Candidatus Glassbacteria bacterium]
MKLRRKIEGIERVVVKIGTRVLTGIDNQIVRERIDLLAVQIVELENQGIATVLVSSGAVGAGMGRLGVENYPRLIPDRQAVAAVGQVQLMKMWEHAFATHGRQVGQVLVTAADLQSRYRYVNMQNTFESLLRMGVLPVVNENDSVAVRELKYGDNDALSVQVAGIIDAGLLVLLTATDGLYTANPEKDRTATRIPVVEKVTGDLIRGASGKSSGLAIGGMRSKLEAASLAGKAGVWCVIAGGIRPDLVGIVEGGDVGTLFVPRAGGLQRRKHWIAFTSRSRGRLLVDKGARRALVENGKSLLSSGIAGIEGSFGSGDVVDIAIAADEAPFARGVTSYSAEDLGRIKGLHSSQIEEVLGHDGPEEVIHKDNLVLLEKRN